MRGAPDMEVAGPRATRLARERFLTTEEVEGGEDAPPSPVRRTILASWERCRTEGVPPETLRVPFVRTPDPQTTLRRSAAQVLDALADQLAGEPVSVVLTDQTGLILERRGSGESINRRLDDVRIAPGFSYAEEFVGTNGIGTALSSGQAVLVDGGEHYADELGALICAGAPIRHPTRGTVVGLVDLTSWREVSGALLASLAAATARQVEHELLRTTGQSELALYAAYLQANRQSHTPVLAVDEGVVITSDSLRSLLEAAEREALTAHVLDSLRSGSPATMLTVQLPTGRSVHLQRVPHGDGARASGNVFKVRLGHSAPPGGEGRSTGRPHPMPPLPGIVGSSAVWAHCVQQVRSCHRSAEWVALEGERGTGRRGLLRAVHLQGESHGRVVVLDTPGAEDPELWLNRLADELTAAQTLVVLVGADRLDADVASAVGDLLVASRSHPTSARVALTLQPGVETPLRAVINRTIEVPALRHHLEDLGELVTHLLGRLAHGDQLSCSPQALEQLARVGWPGNVTQLRRVLTHVHHRRHHGVIDLGDLPAECRTTSTRRLSPLETMERDAIVTALGHAGQSPTSAARTLGVSRATIYRRIRSYGIIVPSD